MKISQLDGGLSLKLDESLIQINEGIVYDNIDTSVGILKSLKDINLTSDPLDPFFYLFKGTFVSSVTDRDYLEFREILYFTRVDGRPKKLTETTEFLLGIDAPIATPAEEGGQPILDEEGLPIVGLVVTSEPFDQLEFPIILAAVGNGDIPGSSTVDYKYTLVEGGVNVTEWTDSITLGAGDSAVQLNLPESGELILRIYRDFSGTFRLLREVVLDDLKIIRDDIFDISNREEFTPIQVIEGTVQYTITYVNELDGVESAPMPISSPALIAFGNKALISNIPSPIDPQVTIKRLYRIGGNLTNFTLITELEIGIETHEDQVADVNATTLLDSFNNLPPPDDLKFLVEAYGIFFGASKDKLVFSDIGSPDTWPAANFIDFDADITSIFPINNGLLVFTRFKTFILFGTTSTTFTKLLLSDEQGNLSHKSSKLVQNIPIWISEDGLCSLVNGYPKVISIPKLGPVSFDIVSAEVFREQYIIILTTGTAFIFDFQAGFKIGTLTTSTAIQSIGNFNNTLFCVADNKQGELFDGPELSVDYTSPLFTNNEHSTRKDYNFIYIRSNGEFIITITIDQLEVLATSLSGNTTHELNVAASGQSGFAIQFSIQGTGKIYEIEFKSLPRQNGR